jgi:hypothetical protein
MKLKSLLGSSMDMMRNPKLFRFSLSKIHYKKKVAKNKYSSKEAIEKYDSLNHLFYKTFHSEIKKALLATKEIKPCNPKNDERIVFVFWGQGEENMPSLIKDCYDSIKRHMPYRVILLTMENYKEYASLDSVIFESLSQGRISMTHFSDLLRLKLLSEYDCIWCDLTLLFIKDVPAEVFDMEYYNIKNNHGFIDRTKFPFYPNLKIGNIYFIRSKSYKKPFLFIYHFYLNYLKKYHRMYEYFTTALLLEFFYHEDEEFHHLVDDLEENNQNCEVLLPLLNEKKQITKEELNTISKDVVFFKLNRHLNIQDNPGYEMILDLSKGSLK